MSNVASASINTFGKASPKADFVPPSEDPVLEIPLSEVQGVLEDLLSVHNLIADLVKDAGILRGRELARITEDHARTLKAERSPTAKMRLIYAYIRQFIAKIRDALKSRPAEGGKVIQVLSKIQARAIQIIDYIKTYGADEGKRDIALDSQKARLLFSGKSGEPVSRRDTIRAMKKAEALWPALRCGHRPNDGRQTMRLTIQRQDLSCGPEFGFRDLWQRFGKRISLSL